MRGQLFHSVKENPPTPAEREGMLPLKSLPVPLEAGG